MAIPYEPTPSDSVVQRRVKRGRRLITEMEARLASQNLRAAHEQVRLGKADTVMIMEALVLLLKNQFGGAE